MHTSTAVAVCIESLMVANNHEIEEMGGIVSQFYASDSQENSVGDWAFRSSSSERTRTLVA